MNLLCNPTECIFLKNKKNKKTKSGLAFNFHIKSVTVTRYTLARRVLERKSNPKHFLYILPRIFTQHARLSFYLNSHIRLRQNKGFTLHIRGREKKKILYIQFSLHHISNISRHTRHLFFFFFSERKRNSIKLSQYTFIPRL